MHRKSKRNKFKRRASYGETLLLVLIGVLTFVLAGSLSDRGIAQKWAVAMMATIITFGLVVYMRRETLRRWSFWASLSICFCVHCISVWTFFHFVLYGIGRFSILFWYPIMLIEVFILLVAEKRIEEKLTGKREIVTLRF